MKKSKVFMVFGLFMISLLVFGCNRVTQETATDDHNPAISASDLFDVSGASAIATASETTSSSSAIRSMQLTDVTELLKLNEAGSIESVLSPLLESQWHPPISVIETGPDGSLYVGFRWPIWIEGESTTEAGVNAAFFSISPSGAVEVVDSTIYGVGTWYGHSENGELPVKQVQFDSDGNLYYLGESSSGTTVLKKKTPGGTISQIGTNRMAVRDFLVAENGFVFFHGSNSESWNIEWLRVIYNNAVQNIFYNDGDTGWLRSYYYHVVDSSHYVFLVGENLTLLDENEIPKKYSGIIRVALSASGEPTAVEALYDDNNMYHDTRSVGEQITWGYWDEVEMADKNFFTRNDHNDIVRPLSLEAGVSEEDIRIFIRNQYQSITSDTLDGVSFEGIAADIEDWQLSDHLDDLISENVVGKTWARWKEENDLQGVRFGNARQLLFGDDGKLYAVMRLDEWGAGSSKGDKLFQIVNASGEAEIIGFSQDTTNYYKSMSRVRLYGNYAIYLSNKVGNYKVLRLDLTDTSAAPVDMLSDKTDVEIFSFSYDETANILYYDMYDLSNNTTHLVSQPFDITAAGLGAFASDYTLISAGNYTITDVVPFAATN